MAEDNKPGGTGPIQQRDSQAAKAGMVRRGLEAARGAWDRRKINKAADRQRIDELARQHNEDKAKETTSPQEAQAPVEGQVQQHAAPRTTPSLDPRAVKGGDLDDFNNYLLDALRRGQARSEDDKSAASVIREVMTNDIFISVIATSRIRTPLEELDEEYAQEMKRKRDNLVEKLVNAKNNPKFMVGDLTTNELDLLYVTMLGTPEEESFERTKREKKERKKAEKEKKKAKKKPKPEEKKEEDKSTGAIEMWANTRCGPDPGDWPKDLPKPPEALMEFLLSVAVRFQPAKRGEYIGSVLKGLAVRSTFVKDSKYKPRRMLVDSSYLNEFLDNGSARPIGRAVRHFQEIMLDLLNTPTYRMHPVLGVPGLGYGMSDRYAKEHQDKLERKGKETADARKAFNDAQKTHQECVDALKQKEAKREEVQAYITEAESTGSTTLPDGNVVKAGDPQLEAAMQFAEGNVRAAAELLDTAWKEVDRTEKDLISHQDELLEFKGYQGLLELKTRPLEEARETLKQANAVLEAFEKAAQAEQGAKKIYDQWNSQLGKLADLIQTAQAQGSVTLENGNVMKAGDPQMQAAFDEANTNTALAKAALDKADARYMALAPDAATARQAKAEAERAVPVLEADLDKFVRESSPEAVAKELAGHFKSLLEQNRDMNVDLESVADKMKDRLPNIVLDRLLDRANKLKPKMEEASEIFHPLKLHQERILSAVVDAETATIEPPAHARQAKQLAALPAPGQSAAGTAQAAAPAAGPAQAPDAPKEEKKPVIPAEDVVRIAKMPPHIQAAYGHALEKGDLANAKALLDEYSKPVANDAKTFRHIEQDFRRQMKEFDNEIARAELPDEVKVRLGVLQKSMDSLMYPSEAPHDPKSINFQIASIRDSYTLPLKKVGQLAVERLKEKGYTNIASITDQDWIRAKLVFEARSDEIPNETPKQIGLWKRIWKWADENLLSAKPWISRDPDHPGYLVKAWRWSFADPWRLLADVDNWHIRDKIISQKWGVYRRWPRGVRGAWGMGWRSYLLVGMLAGMALGQEEHWYNPFSWQTDFHWYNPFAMASSGLRKAGLAPAYSSERHWYTTAHWYFPWTWMMTPESERRILRVIDDHYDIVPRLPTRTDEFYRRQYGVTKNFDWLRQHVDVLRFLQERSTGRQDVRFRDLPGGTKNQENCTNFRDPRQKVQPQGSDQQKQAQEAAEPQKQSREQLIPVPCQHPGLGLGSEELVASYQPLTRTDEWRPGQGYTVCCTIEVSSVPVSDGLRLNKHRADQLVADLMAFEKAGGTVTYGYLTRRSKIAELQEHGYLITAREAEIMQEYKIIDSKNVEFILLQGSVTPPAEAAKTISRLLLRSSAEEALAPVRLRESARDEFVQAWRAEIIRSQKALPENPRDVDPLKELMPYNVLEQAFDAVLAKHVTFTERVQGATNKLSLASVLELEPQNLANLSVTLHSEAFEERILDYQRLSVRQKVREFNFQDVASFDALARNPDILELVQKFATPARYGINPQLSDSVISEFMRHKDRGESLNDFDQTCEEGCGRLIPVMVARSMFIDRQANALPGSQDRGEGGGSAEAQQPQPAQPAPPAATAQRRILECTGDCSAFYARPENGEFMRHVTGTVNSYLDRRGSDGDILRTALGSVFANNREKLVSAAKRSVYDLFISDKAPDIAARAQWGLNISGSGPTLTVTINNLPTARTKTGSHIRQFARSLTQGTAGPTGR